MLRPGAESPPKNHDRWLARGDGRLARSGRFAPPVQFAVLEQPSQPGCDLSVLRERAAWPWDFKPAARGSKSRRAHQFRLGFGSACGDGRLGRREAGDGHAVG